MSNIFLGGTCNGSKWRDRFIPLLEKNGLSYFNPVVPDWNDEAYRRELSERETSHFVLYVITPKSDSVYSIAEVVDDSNKRPEKTLFLVLGEDDDLVFNPTQLKHLSAVSKMVVKNGGLCFTTFDHVILYLNMWKRFNEEIRVV